MAKNEEATQAIDCEQVYVIDQITDVAPSDLSAASMDLQWLVEHDDERRSPAYWLGKALVSGAAQQKRSMEYARATREAKAAQKRAAENLERFTKTILMNPKILSEARNGNPTLMLNTAASFEVPVNVVLEFLKPEPSTKPEAKAS